MSRLDGVKKIFVDSLDNEEKIPVFAVTRMFMDITEKMMEEEGTALNYIKEELGNNFLRKLLAELGGSLIGSIHMSSKFKNDIEGARKYAKETQCYKIINDTDDDDEVGGQA